MFSQDLAFGGDFPSAYGTFCSDGAKASPAAMAWRQCPHVLARIAAVTEHRRSNGRIHHPPMRGQVALIASASPRTT